MTLKSPSQAEFCNGINEFKRHEPRDYMYNVSKFFVDHYWGNPEKMSDGLGTLLLTWNQAFYRYGPFDFDKL